MAKDFQTKKRKASVPESGAVKFKKVKKTESQPLPEKKRKATDDSAIPDVKKTKVTSSITKPKVEQSTKPTIVKKSITSEKAEKKKNDGDSKASKVTLNGTAASKKDNSKPKPKAPEPTPSSDVEMDDEDEDEDDDEASDIDDQTEALLQGFESDGDEEDAKNTAGLPEGEAVPELSKSAKKKLKKSLKKHEDAIAADKPGVVYIGRIPHGFYEYEMREYFKQFGTILKLRLSRNRKTGASKHFAFIQFESLTVADIVARTMDNYLLFGHLLKVKVIPEAQVSPDMFKGANKRFKKVPWNKMEGRKINQGASEAVWEKRIKSENTKRSAKADKMKALGYEFDLPTIKSAKGVAKNVESPAPALLEKDVAEPKAIEAAPVPVTSSKPKKEKKVKTTVVVTAEDTPAVKEPEKAKKVKKTKVTEITEVVSAAEVPEPAVAGEASAGKAKKHKKNKKPKTT